MCDYREKVRAKLDAIFEKDVDNRDDIIAGIEKGIYNFSLTLATKYSVIKKWENPEFAEIYKDIAYKILVNLDKDSYVANPKLMEKVLSDEVKPSKLAGMTSQELHPEKWEALFQEKLKKTNMKYENNLATTDFYKCPKCKKARATFYQVQLRSADEPMSTLLNCLECGYDWRIN
jgi:DNA-directed RNA polymerase subunit M/transcription elongation factor TFIIS